jgi:hypothetical protein
LTPFTTYRKSRSENYAANNSVYVVLIVIGQNSGMASHHSNKPPFSKQKKPPTIRGLF